MEYHVATTGNDRDCGTARDPFRSIQAAADRAQPGDVVTVHEGVYRERVNPPRGGLSDGQRIIYQAAPGEQVAIKGSEIIRDWNRLDGNVWVKRLPNAYFGGFNPFAHVLSGDWFLPLGRTHHSGAVFLNDTALNEARTLDHLFESRHRGWFAKSGEYETCIWINVGDADPNTGLLETTRRQTVFYPARPGINYLTVKGFTLSQAATPWSPPTTEQIGLIGVNWSKGWIIEDNTITHSRCAGLTLGKYFDKEDGWIEYGFNAHYQTVQRVLARGDWTPDRIGGHVVRNNHIAFCEQAGIVGSHGGAFCTIVGNVIHDIHTRALFGGLEQAGIKLHAPVDTLIGENLIYRCNMGIWMDWMTQGTRITGNLLYDNREQDLFMEIGHGPFLVDHNLFLSPTAVLDSAQGGAYAHNLFGGAIRQREEATRGTPFFKPHSTEWAGEGRVLDGDERFTNNLFAGDGGLKSYDANGEPLWMDGNVFLHGAKPCRLEKDALHLPNADNRFTVREDPSGITLHMAFDPAWRARKCQMVTTKRLGNTMLSGQAFEERDGSDILLDRDYFGKRRDPESPTPGPFEEMPDQPSIRVWPPSRASGFFPRRQEAVRNVGRECPDLSGMPDPFRGCVQVETRTESPPHDHFGQEVCEAVRNHSKKGKGLK